MATTTGQARENEERILNQPLASDQGGVSGVDLLKTNFRHEYMPDRIDKQVRDFIVKEYSPTALIPSITWIPKYVRGEWKEKLWGDFTAGLTVGAFLVPQGMSYALIADLPPNYGLYTASIPLIVYALLGTSKELSVGPVAIMSLIVGHGVGAIVSPHLEDGKPNPEFISLCIAVGLLNGVLLLLMGIFRLGFITSFLSHPVLSGFTTAAALIMGMGQMKSVLGYSLSESENWFEVLFDMLERLPEAHYPSVLMAIGTMVVLQTFKTIPILKKLPSAMIVVVVSVLVSWGFELKAKHGFSVCGSIPAGIPMPAPPAIPSGDRLSALFTVVIVSSLIGYMESIAVALTYASKNKYSLNSNQELIAFGVSNMVGSFFLCFPNAGGFGRSSVNADSGAKSQLAGLFSGLFILIVLAFLTPLFYHLPKPALGGIVIMAVTGIFDYNEPIHLYRTRAWTDLFSYLVTFFATLIVGFELGIGIGVGCSIISLLAVTSSPNYAVLGKVKGTENFFDIKVFEQAEEIPKTLIIRFDADLWFANAARFKDAILRECYQRAETQELYRVILSFQAVNMIDSSAIHALHETVQELQSGGGALSVSIAGAKRTVRARLIRELHPGSWVTPGEAPSALVEGVSRPQIAEAFTAHKATRGGRLPRDAAAKLAKRIKALRPSVKTQSLVVALGLLKEGLPAAEAEMLAVGAPRMMEDGEGELLSFAQFMQEYFAPLAPEGGEERAPAGDKGCLLLYPSIHAAVTYDVSHTREPSDDAASTQHVMVPVWLPVGGELVTGPGESPSTQI